MRRPFLGISARGEELEPAQAAEAGRLRAIRVLEVVEGSPARTA